VSCKTISASAATGYSSIEVVLLLNDWSPRKNRHFILHTRFAFFENQPFQTRDPTQPTDNSGPTYYRNSYETILLHLLPFPVVIVTPPQYVRCDDFVDVIVIRRCHVGGMLNTNKYCAKTVEIWQFVSINQSISQS